MKENVLSYLNAAGSKPTASINGKSAKADCEAFVS